MTTNIFVNLAVKDLAKSKKFWEALGYSFNKQFTDETAGSLVISENIYAMLLTEEKFKQFTKKDLADSTKTTEAIIALSVDSKAEVDQMLEKVVEAGGKPYRDPENYGFMYSKSFEDLDGHIWEILWMDPDYIK
jgi:uncharacterized protein